MRLRKHIALLADDTDATPEATETEKVIEEEDDGKEKPEEKEEEPEVEEEQTDDTEEENSDDGGGEPADEPADTPAPAADDLGGDRDDTPAEDKQRHDTGVNSTDIVVNASNVIRQAQEIVTEDMNDHSNIEEMYEQADGEGKALGRLAFELDADGREISSAMESCNALGLCLETLGDEWHRGGINVPSLSAIKILSDRIAKTHGLKFQGKAMERAILIAKTPEFNRRIAMEGIGSMLQAIWDAICNAFKRMWKWITSFFSVAKETTEKVKEKTKQQKEQIRELKKRFDKLEDPKKKQVEALFALTQTFDPEKPTEGFAGIPSELKDKEEIIKKAVQESGVRFKQSELGHFFFGDAFASPSEIDKSKQELKGSLTTFAAACETMGKISSTIEPVIKAAGVVPPKTDPEIQNQKAEVDRVLGDLGNAINDIKTKMRGVAVNNSNTQGLFEVESEELQVYSCLDTAKLPCGNTLAFIVIKDGVGPALNTVPALLRKHIGKIRLSLVEAKTFASQAGTVTDSFVSHSDFKGIEKDLETFIDSYIDDLSSITKAQVSRVEKMGSGLNEEIEKAKRNVDAGDKTDQETVTLLNNIAKMVTQLVTDFIPKFAKVMVGLGADYVKHTQRSLNAFDACLKIVEG